MVGPILTVLLRCPKSSRSSAAVMVATMQRALLSALCIAGKPAWIMKVSSLSAHCIPVAAHKP